MKYNKYGSKIAKGEEEEEYFKNRELINVKELGVIFEQKAKMKLSSYKKIFDRFEQHGNDIFKFPMNTALTKEQLKQLTKVFFERIDKGMCAQVDEIFENGENTDMTSADVIFEIKDIYDKGDASCSRIDIAGDTFPLQFDLEEIKKRDPDLYANLKRMMEPRVVMILSITRTGNISDLYNLVHELTHYFIMKETKDTGLLDEIASHCMERLVDDFLLSLTPDECKEFNFDKNKITEDVLLRNIASFAIRYNSVKEFNKKSNNNERGAVEQEHLKYILALIYQSRFAKFNFVQRKEKIIELIDSIKNNDFNKVNEIFQIRWDDKLKKQKYIEKPISDVLNIFELYKAKLKDSKVPTVNIIEENEGRAI